MVGVHCQFAGCCAGPCCAWTIPVEFDAVLIGVAKVEGLADAVVGSTVERNFVGDEGFERLAEGDASRVDDGQVIEAGGAWWWRITVLALPGVEADVVVVASRGDEGSRRA